MAEMNLPRYERMIKEVQEDIDWLNKASIAQKDRLKMFLLNLDKSNITDMDSGRSKTIIQGVNQIIHNISKKIEERLPAFRGKLLPVGSAHNGTKIGQPDEFDFVHEMDGVNVLSAIRPDAQLERPKGTKDDFNTRVEYDGTSFRPNVFNHSFVALIKGYGLHKANDHTHTVIIRKVFKGILKEVLTELELPSGWYHGGFNRPNVSGLRIAGPAFLLQFDYLTKDDKDHLKLSVDFVPLITVKDPSKETGFLHKVLKDLPHPGYHWLSIVNTNLYDYGYGVEEWLNQYSGASMPKTLMRIFKNFNGLVELSSSKFLSRYNHEKIVNIIKQKKHGHSIKPADLQDLHIESQLPSYLEDPSDDIARYSDLGEISGNCSLLKSHMIKALVLAMMAVGESGGHEWTEDDLPDLVMSFYMLITNAIKSVWSEVESIEDGCFIIPIIVKESSVSLNSLLLTNTTYSLPTKAEKPLSKPKLEASEFVRSLESAFPLKINTFLGSTPIPPYSFELSRIEAIFRVLRCVCEGKESAQIQIVRHKLVGTHFITKRELEKMLMDDEDNVVPETVVTD